MNRTPSPGRRLHPLAEAAVFLGLFTWLALAAAWVRVEYFDGWDTVANAKYFAGAVPQYLASRCPGLALWLTPAELARPLFSWHPLEIRPHHALMALLHAGYLTGVYVLMARQFGRRPATLLAFVLAVPCFLFFSYAPFISHDLFPGLFLLLMLLLAERMDRAPGVMTWLALVLLGAAAALVKQTFAVFWVLVLVSQLVCGLMDRDSPARQARTLGLLAGAAIASGVITWTILAMVLESSLPGVSFWMRPYQTIGQLKAGLAPTWAGFPAWIYAANFWAYGITALALAIPGMVLALVKGPRLLRMVAVSFLGALVILHLIPYREVRYLGFLAPLAAFLAVRPLGAVLKKPLPAACLGVLILADLFFVVPEAARIGKPFYRNPPQNRFFAPLCQPGPKPVTAFDQAFFSFFPDSGRIFRGDPYHRAFHFGWQHLVLILEIPGKNLVALRRVPAINPRAVLALNRQYGKNRPVALIHAEGVRANNRFYKGSREMPEEDFRLELWEDRTVEIAARKDGVFFAASGEPVDIFRQGEGGAAATLMESPAFAPLAGTLAPCLLDPATGTALALEPLGPARYRILGDVRPEEILSVPRWRVRGMVRQRTYLGGDRVEGLKGPD